MSCPDCKDSILNKTKSSIPNPICQGDDCPESIDCDGVSISTDCITVNAALDCSDTEVGDVLTDVLEAMDVKICTATGGTVKVSISEPDTCPGYLENKIIAGSGITITKSASVSGCEKLTVAETCWEWNSVLPAGSTDGTFKNGWNNYNAAYQSAGYSDVKECTVKLRGTVLSPVLGIPGCGVSVIFTLPAGSRPVARRIFSVVIVNSCKFIPAHLTIYPNGNVELNCSSISGLYYLALDGVFFENN